MEELWIDLYECGYIEINDVKVVQLWLSALVEIGYEFPRMKHQRLDHTVLMGQFNYNQNTSLILFWHQKWRQWFNKIVARVPMDETQKQELERHGIKAYVSRNDRGYVSPVENLAATLQQYKNVDGVSGVLYAHDDMLLNVTEFFPSNFEFGKDQILTTVHTQLDDDHFPSFKLLPDGTYSIRNGNGFTKHTDKEALLANIPAFQKSMSYRFDGYPRILNDPLSKFMLDSDGALGGVTTAQSDLLYVATSLAEDFDRSAQLMVKHELFLECAIPMIIRNLYKLSNATVEKRRLCTHWVMGERGTTKMLEMCYKDSPYSAFHPFKISADPKAWNGVFEWATTGSHALYVSNHT
jgi:hypothetical protein